MGAIQELASDLGAEERTLRRAVAQGTLRARRVGERRLRLAPGEKEYLRTHWELLAGLRRALRTERRVRFAVLYGSVARGDADPGSDLDLLVTLSDESTQAEHDLTVRLRGVVDRPVDIARLARVQADAPLLLDRVLDEGRVLIDRDGQWPRLRANRRAIRVRAERAHRRQMTDAARALGALTSA